MYKFEGNDVSPVSYTHLKAEKALSAALPHLQTKQAKCIRESDLHWQTAPS